jgi:uncharacterized protein DUF4255/carboxypeptidase family protein
MIDYVGRMLEHVVATRVDAGIAVSFDPPDKDWRAQRSADRPTLDIYLVDLRENRTLRSTASVRSVQDGLVTEQPAPLRLDCLYLVSAWSNTKPGPATAPTLDEHRLLHRFSSALAGLVPFGAAAVYATDPLPPGFPAELVEQALPLHLLPAEGYQRLAEFWGTMGDAQALKPVVPVVVTVPLGLPPLPRGPLVHTQRVRTFPREEPASRDERFTIAGSVLDTTTAPDPTPLPAVWIDLLLPDGSRRDLQRSDEVGRFVFSGLPGGEYRLRATATGHDPLTVPITVPATDKAVLDPYDLRFAAHP